MIEKLNVKMLLTAMIIVGHALYYLNKRLTRTAEEDVVESKAACVNGE